VAHGRAGIDGGSTSESGIASGVDFRSAATGVVQRASAIAQISGARASIAQTASALSSIDPSGELWIFVPETEEAELVSFGSGGQLGTGLTAYLGPGGLTEFEERARWPVPRGRSLELHITLSEAPGAGSIIVTLRREVAGVMVDTAQVVTITGTDEAGLSTAIVSFADVSTRVSLRVESVAAPKTTINGSMKFSFTLG
jgi:hypothetical protein